MYENGSLENYARVVERRAQRSRLLHDKMEKPRSKEPMIEEEDDAKRKQRRMQREVARQRRILLLRQEAKQADDQARQTVAAITMQRVIRGALARRIARVLRLAQLTHGAALVLQRAMKVYVSRQQVERERERRARERDEDRERELHSAATVLQRQTRKHLKALQEARQQATLAAFAEDEESDDDSEDQSSDMESGTRRPLENARSADEKIADEALRRGISLDLLFSDEEDNALPTKSMSSSSITLIDAESFPLRPQPPPLKSQRNLIAKRVGGGYLLSLSSLDTAMNASIEGEASDITTAYTSPSLDAKKASSSALCVDEKSQRYSKRSPTMHGASLVSPVLVSHPAQQSFVSTKKTYEGMRITTPVKGSAVSPYAIVQRLLP